MASADHEAATSYPEALKKIIVDKGYTAHQVFICDETGLWWKKMPNRTFISKNEETAPGFKVSKDRITLLLCSNASGDCMTKPMLIYRSLNPRALKGVNENRLPVHWAANSKAWITADLFKNWFVNCFVPEVENYLKQKNLDFKVLLLLDNAPGHPKDLSHPNVQIEFLPPNTTSLIQPLDQGIIYTFKTYYIRRSLQWILDATDSKSIDVINAWKSFSIKECMEIISLSLKELKITTLNRCWKKLWPEAVEKETLDASAENEVSDILEVARTIGGEGFTDMTADDIQRLLEEEEIVEADLVEMVSLTPEHINSSSDGDDSETSKFTLEKVKKILALGEELKSLVLNTDPSSERRQKVKRELQNCLAPYHEICNDLRNASRQSKITQFLKVGEGTQNLNVNCVTQPNKRSRLFLLSSDDDEN